MTIPLRSLVRQGLYLVGQGLQGLRVAPGQTLWSVLLLAVTASLVSLAIAFGGLAARLSEQAARGSRVLVYLKDPVPTADVQRLMSRLQGQADVESVTYLTREQDRAENARLLPPDLVASLPPEAIPGQHALEVSLRFRPEAPEGPDALLASLRALEEVDLVAEPVVGGQRLRAMAAAVDLGRTILLAMAVLLLVGSLSFVVATLTRTLDRRRDEVTLLRLLGATEGFLRTPLMVQGVLQGMVGLGLGVLGGALVADGLSAWLEGRHDLQRVLVMRLDLALPLALAAGLVLGLAGALVASRRKEA